MSDSPEDLPTTPDTYEGAAELDPDNWRDDPLVREGDDVLSDDEDLGPAAVAVSGTDLDADDAANPDDPVDLDNPVVPSEQELRDETAEARYWAGDEQVPPEEPRMGEAMADLDVPGDPAFEDEIDPSNDPFHGGADL